MGPPSVFCPVNIRYRLELDSGVSRSTATPKNGRPGRLAGKSRPLCCYSAAAWESSTHTVRVIPNATSRTVATGSWLSPNSGYR